MKIRAGFISNSSSSSFIITNKTDETKTFVDFIEENPQIIEEFRAKYDWHTEEDGYTQEELLKSAAMNTTETLPPNSSDEYWFGDEEDTMISKVFDYALRDGGDSKSFTWRIKSCRGTEY